MRVKNKGKKIYQSERAKTIDKDFAAVFKKHKLERAAIVAIMPDGNGGNTRMSSCHIKGEKDGKTLTMFTKAISALFSNTDLDTKNIELAASIIKMAIDRFKPSPAELALSEHERKRLAEVRGMKHALVRAEKFEEAAAMRMEEWLILGMEMPKKEKPCDVTFDLKFTEIEKSFEKVFDDVVELVQRDKKTK